MKGRLIGIVLLLLIVGGGLLYQFYLQPQAPATILRGYVGGEKMELLADPEVIDLLGSRFGITVDYTKAGSIEMVKEEIGPDIDFLWPSSQVALELFKNAQGSRLVKSEIILNSPIVLYSWDIVTEALIRAGIVEMVDNAYYIVDFPKLINLVVEEKSWADIGLNDLYGKIIITSTDPTKSNSGNMFAGLLASILSGDVVNETTLPQVLPTVVRTFTRQGYMEHSSSDLFEQYLRTGVGAKPIIAGYESQIIEFSLQYPELWPKVKDKIRILYPVPTVWSSHPLIILRPESKVMIEALQDADVQRLAWEKHGFRTGMIGVENDPRVLAVVGVPESITKVISMPSPEIMEEIINTLSNSR